MRVFKIEPNGWPSSLKECPPGPFVSISHPGLLCFKTEYFTEGHSVMAFNSAGEYFVSGDSTLVQPVLTVDYNEDE